METYEGFTDERYTPETDPTGLKDFQRSELAISINAGEIGNLVIKLAEEELKKDSNEKVVADINKQLDKLEYERDRIYSGDAVAKFNCIKNYQGQQH
jgi:hypothetical protein